MCNGPIRERKWSAPQNIQITEIKKWYWNNAMIILARSDAFYYQ